MACVWIKIVGQKEDESGAFGSESLPKSFHGAIAKTLKFSHCKNFEVQSPSFPVIQLISTGSQEHIESQNIHEDDRDHVTNHVTDHGSGVHPDSVLEDQPHPASKRAQFNPTSPFVCRQASCFLFPCSPPPGQTLDLPWTSAVLMDAME